MNTGYKGRTGIFEVLIIDEMVQSNDHPEEICKGDHTRRQGGGDPQDIEGGRAQKAADGITSLEEAALAVID